MNAAFQVNVYPIDQQTHEHAIGALPDLWAIVLEAILCQTNKILTLYFDKGWQLDMRRQAGRGPLVVGVLPTRESIQNRGSTDQGTTGENEADHGRAALIIRRGRDSDWLAHATVVR